MKEMETAYRLAAVAVRQRFLEQRPEVLETLRRLTKHDIAVYTGVHDSVQKVFGCLKLPVTLNPDAEKTQAKIHFVNCGMDNEPIISAIGKRVEEGAWLVTSDWALRSTVQHLYPEKVRWNGRTTGDEVVAVEAFGESLWSDLVVPGADPQWWLEASSFPIEILDTEQVHIEAASHEMLVRYNAPVVAFRFAAGRGQVFHVISHFWLKRSRVPAERYAGPCADFLKAGMRLSDEGIAETLRVAQVAPDQVTFAAIQSAATATELVAQLCVRAANS